jgi:hypothetical protein
MQSTDPNTRITGALNHPEAAAWMSFLYDEVPAAKRRELEAHLAQCPACAAQVKAWREGMNSLDGWTMPARRPARPALVPLVRWAAAAALILALGIALGRQTSRNTAEIAALRSSVAELTSLVQHQSESSVTNGTAAAKAETARLLADFTRLQDVQRVEDQNAVNLRLHALDDRIETVALNTQSGFEQTHQVLASFTQQPPTLPDH